MITHQKGAMGWGGRGRWSWGRGSYCYLRSAVRGLRSQSWEGGGTGVVCGPLHVVMGGGVQAATGHSGVVFRERRGGGDPGDGDPWPRGSIGVKRARACSLNGWAEGGFAEELGRVTRGELRAGWGQGGSQEGGFSREDPHWGATERGERTTRGDPCGDAVPAPEPSRVAPGLGGCWSPCRQRPQAPRAPAAETTAPPPSVTPAPDFSG